MPAERAIRDELALDLTVLEEGMSVVRIEYPLPNAHGTRGSIDILARDRFGTFVVIELKRSNDAASRALHELFKYAGLLAREKGLDQSEVRCRLVSTDWDELRVPFSLMLETFPYDTVGFHVTVDERGVILSSETVEPLPETEPHGITPVHHIFFFGNADARDAAWSEVSAILSSIDSPHHVGLALDRRLPFEGWPHALYLVVGRTSPTAKLRHLQEDVPDDSIEAPAGYVWEYRALCELASRYRKADGTEIGYPDKLRYLLGDDGRWSASQVFRAGRFAAQADLVQGDELLEAIGGTSGASEVALGLRTSPARGGHWRASREKIRRCLFGNPNWEGVLAAYFDEVEAKSARAEIAFAAFNPCDVVGSLVSTVTGEEERSSLPHLECQVIINDEVTRCIVGTLVFRPRDDVADIARAFREVYGDVMGWGLARNVGETWAFDIDLCDQTGLEYACLEFIANDSRAYGLTLSDSGLRRSQVATDPRESTDMRPLEQWLRQNRVGLATIVEMMASHTRGLFPGLDAVSE